MLFSLPVAISRCALRQISQFFKGAPRRRAAPGNQSVESPQSRRLRLARYRSGRARGLPHTMSGKRAADEEGFSLKVKARCRAMLATMKYLLQVRAISSHPVRPNPSLKWSANGSQAGPRHSAGVHFL